MNWYYFIFVWIAAIFFISEFWNVETLVEVSGRYEIRWSITTAIIAFLPIFLLATIGDPIGDVPGYLDGFKEMSTSIHALMQSLTDADGGKGFVVFEFIIKRIFGNNETAFRILLGLFQSIPVVLIIRKYSENYIFSIYLFAATSCHLAWMMNGLRQFLAVAIIFAATPLLIRKKYVLLIGIIVIAATIHTSALIMLPVIFIVQGKAWNKKTILYIIVAVIAMYLFGKYTGLMDSMLVGTEYAGATSTWKELGDDGVNPIRVVVNMVPMLLSLFGRDYLDTDDTVLNICINMSVITTGLYLIAMTTSGIMIGRLPIYTSLYNLILLPTLIDRIFEKSSARAVSIIACIFYFIYYCVEMGVL